jgi:hypothetical protein
MLLSRNEEASLLFALSNAHTERMERIV